MSNEKGCIGVGLFTKSQQKIADDIYATTKPHLKPKDGFVHVVMISSFSKWLNQYLCCDDKYTTQIDLIITAMQKDGYEIVDVKFSSSINSKGLFNDLGDSERFNTLIMYK